jgi:hypothetical protein
MVLLVTLAEATLHDCRKFVSTGLQARLVAPTLFALRSAGSRDLHQCPADCGASASH